MKTLFVVSPRVPFIGGLGRMRQSPLRDPVQMMSPLEKQLEIKPWNTIFDVLAQTERWVMVEFDAPKAITTHEPVLLRVVHMVQDRRVVESIRVVWIGETKDQVCLIRGDGVLVEMPESGVDPYDCVPVDLEGGLFEAVFDELSPKQTPQDQEYVCCGSDMKPTGLTYGNGWLCECCGYKKYDVASVKRSGNYDAYLADPRVYVARCCGRPMEVPVPPAQPDWVCSVCRKEGQHG